MLLGSGEFGKLVLEFEQFTYKTNPTPKHCPSNWFCFPQYGLNSAFMGCFVYVIFGSIKEVSIGPTSLMALLTYEYTQNLSPDFVVLLCFLVGCVEFLMGFLRLGEY